MTGGTNKEIKKARRDKRMSVKIKNVVHLSVSVARDSLRSISQILLSRPSSSLSVGHLRATIRGRHDGAVSIPAVQGLLVPPRLMPL
jgi:hypothetical protein